MIPGGWEWLIILAVVVLLFGGSKLPKLGGALGESIKNFRKGIKDVKDSERIPPTAQPKEKNNT
ncbi:MAG: twin-arginine translocase TatA/TatE family subunit [Proteobacteria bacterium]|nr:twin-arginine translocase TatA/TatE family subunit [Pseudomonadota bacterium]